ncbi:hypothetical protein SUGI_0346760 [Cryptomeria japonica]|nr:hypothetical protein SUGI_0346760 [Cryptomeria japonica]
MGTPEKNRLNKDIKRLFFSAFYHVDDSHFVYNMESLLREGVQLEMKGSTDFASAVVVLLGMSHGIEDISTSGYRDSSLVAILSVQS